MNYLADDALAPKLSRSTATIDTIELFQRRPPRGLRTAIERAVGQRIQIAPVLDASGYQQGVRVIINRPARAVLSAIVKLKRYSICRIDVAFDLLTHSEDAADALITFLRRHVILKWRAAENRTHIDETTYWVSGRKSRNLCLYRKGRSLVRLELRFQNSGAVRRAHLDTTAKLAAVRPCVLFQHQIKLLQFKEKFVTESVRRAVKTDRLRHLQKEASGQLRANKRAAAFLDQYRAMIPRRARKIWERIDLPEYVAGRKNAARVTEKLSLAWLKLPDKITWRRNKT